ncbi:MAG: glycosyltransferase family 39 protein [Anaerolineae bacterium]|nr:glycosyltransferase family 39 protein [Anaerolineae bacterium]
MPNTTHAQMWQRALRVLIILAYVAIAGMYAAYTPAWQAPDEPAHYNYIRYLAESGRLPVLQPGDYNQEYLETIKARRFPSDMPIAPIRYEFHQPPLYYLLATPIYWVTRGRLIPLRFFSILLGVGLLLVTYAMIRLIFPKRVNLALGGMAFVAFLPQHVAMSAAVNNDILGELILASCVALSLSHMLDHAAPNRRRLLALGILMGLGTLTKTTAYLVLPLALLAIVWRGLQRKENLGRPLVYTFTPAALLGLPWWIRNWSVYGPWDILGLGRHNVVVVGQPRTSEWLGRMGLGALLKQGGMTTFRSFWGQFGWMGVLMDSRIYAMLAILSGVVAIGCAWGVWRLWHPLRKDAGISRLQWSALGLLATWILLTIASYLWYNLTFVQHQGRYLFPALPAWGLCFAWGLDQALRSRPSRWIGGLLLGLALAYVALGVTRGHVGKWGTILSASAGVVLIANSLLPRRWHGPIVALAYVGMGGLDLLALFRFIIPQLS